MQRTLRLFDVVCIGLNAIVGSGVFALPDDLYRALGPWSPLAFVLCALGLWPVALCYAEAASRVEPRQDDGYAACGRRAFVLAGAWGGQLATLACNRAIVPQTLLF